MKSKISFSTVFIIISLSLLSCKKDVIQNTKSVKDTITGYFELKDLNNNNGSISFNSGKSFAPNSKAVYQVSSVLFDKEGNQIKLGNLNINDLVIQPTHQGIISTDIKISDQIGSLYGKELNIQAFKDNSGLNARADEILLNSNLRLPSEIRIISPSPTTAGPTIRRTEIIRWIPDPGNTKKMFIAIEFDPNRGDNKNFKSNKANANYVEVDDTGSYQLQPNDFKGIPNKSSITIYIARGNYTKTTSVSGREKYAVLGYSMAQHQFISE